MRDQIHIFSRYVTMSSGIVSVDSSFVFCKTALDSAAADDPPQPVLSVWYGTGLFDVGLVRFSPNAGRGFSLTLSGTLCHAYHWPPRPLFFFFPGKSNRGKPSSCVIFWVRSGLLLPARCVVNLSEALPRHRMFDRTFFLSLPSIFGLLDLCFQFGVKTSAIGGA